MEKMKLVFPTTEYEQQAKEYIQNFMNMIRKLMGQEEPIGI